MSNCSSCGASVPDGQGSCSCGCWYGDPYLSAQDREYEEQALQEALAEKRFHDEHITGPSGQPLRIREDGRCLQCGKEHGGDSFYICSTCGAVLCHLQLGYTDFQLDREIEAAGNDAIGSDARKTKSRLDRTAHEIAEIRFGEGAAEGASLFHTLWRKGPNAMKDRVCGPLVQLNAAILAKESEDDSSGTGADRPLV